MQFLCSCLVDGKKADSRFLPRYHSSAIVLHLQTFKFAPGEEVSGALVVGISGVLGKLVSTASPFSSLLQVYIHCKLVAWDPELLNEGKKACNYNSKHGG